MILTPVCCPFPLCTHAHLPYHPTASNYYADYLLHMVDYDVVNKVIEEDFSHGDGTYTIYLLNPPSHVPYAYTYSNGM